MCYSIIGPVNMPGPTAGNILPPSFPSELVLPRQIFVRALLLPGDLAWYFLGDPVSSCPSSPSTLPEHACVGRHGGDAKGRGIPAERWQLLCDGCAEPGHSADAGRLSICGGGGGSCPDRDCWVTGGPWVEDVRLRTREDVVSLKQ